MVSCIKKIFDFFAFLLFLCVFSIGAYCADLEEAFGGRSLSGLGNLAHVKPRLQYVEFKVKFGQDGDNVSYLFRREAPDGNAVYLGDDYVENNLKVTTPGNCMHVLRDQRWLTDKTRVLNTCGLAGTQNLDTSVTIKIVYDRFQECVSNVQKINAGLLSNYLS